MSVDKLKRRLERLAEKDGRDEDILEILHQLNSIPMSVEILKATHIGKTVNALRKRKGVVGSSALSLINSWKQLVKEDNKPKPQIVVERCPSPPDDDNDDSDDIDGDDREVTEATSYSRVSHEKKSPSPNPNLRTFNMFEGVKQPSYSRTKSNTKSRSLSPMPSSHMESHMESPSSSSYLNKSLSPQSLKRKVPLIDTPSADSAALSKRSRTQVYSGRKADAGVPSLFELALKVLMTNINVLEEVRGVPYRIMEPVLARCTSSQLQRLESFNPHFLGRGDSLWQKHCQKEFKGTQPRSGQTWRDLYMKQVEMREERLRKISDNINAKKLQQEPVRTVKIAEATRMKRRQRNPPPQVFTPTSQPRGVTPLMSKTLKMVKERSQMFGSSKPRR